MPASTVGCVNKWVAALLDLVCVLVFVAVGIRAHAEADTIVQVAAPFVVALLIGWIVALPLREPQSLKAGVVIWLVTLVGGMALRHIGGDGTATAFVVVAATFLAATMLGWRAVLALIVRRRHAQA